MPGKAGVPGGVLEAVVDCIAKESGTASSTPPGTPLFPGTGPGTFQEFLSSTRFCGQWLRKSKKLILLGAVLGSGIAFPVLHVVFPAELP